MAIRAYGLHHRPSDIRCHQGWAIKGGLAQPRVSQAITRSVAAGKKCHCAGEGHKCARVPAPALVCASQQRGRPLPCACPASSFYFSLIQNNMKGVGACVCVCVVGGGGPYARVHDPSALHSVCGAQPHDYSPESPPNPNRWAPAEQPHTCGAEGSAARPPGCPRSSPPGGYTPAGERS